ncbi:MAG: hypothetical protein HFE47_02015 [Clostridia bacterium]|nr:hypothetical protein [Clostridia bacterium]
MKLVLCALIIGLFLLYIVRVCRKATEPAFAVKGILTGEKLNYMMSALAFGAKKTQKGNGIGLHSLRRILYAARKTAGEALANEKYLHDCERILFNDFYLIEETLSCVYEARKSLRALPHVHGIPRLYSLCELLVKSVGGVVSEESVRSAVCAYTAETPLTYSELSALDTMLQVALCEYLAVYAQKIMRMRERIDCGETDRKNNRIDYALLRKNDYVYGLCATADDTFLRENRILAGEDMRARLDRFMLTVAEYNAHISAAIRSLHTVRSFFCEEFVQKLSPVYAVLDEGDATFARLSLSTKSMYLHEIARLARIRRTTEKSIASEILFSATKNGKDISEYLLPALHDKAFQRLYIAGIIGAVVVSAIVWALIVPRWGWLCAIIGIPVLLFGVHFLWQALAKRVVRRRRLPAYDVRSLDTQKDATNVLLPCFAATGGDIENAFEHLATVAAANPQPLFSYCLLFDYPRSDTDETLSDVGLNEKIKYEYARLGGLSEKVCVMVRRRKRVTGEEYYQGYEKKRGAVLDFNHCVLCGDGDFALLLGKMNRNAKYAITLDSDTLTGDCAELVATMSHPYCKNFAVLSLRCATNRNGTAYARLFSGETGPGRYRRDGDNVYHHLFGLGNYTGKGIYNVSMFQNRVSDVFPDNRILSHDFIEGAMAGCLDTSAAAAEDFPQTFDDDFTRRLRWLRGDWQLLPYVFPRIKDKGGSKRRNPLNPVSKYAILSNLVLSVVPVTQILLLLFALFFAPYGSVFVLALLPQLLRAVFAVRAFMRHPKQMLMEWGRGLFDIAVLPTVAIYELCAVVVTLGRLITKRKLLEWRVFAHAKGRISFLANPAAAALFTVWAAVFGKSPVFFVLALLFCAGAVVPALLSVQSESSVRSDALLSLVTDAAKDTFAYFDAQEKLYKLPCDCYQEDNGKGWCARTSPTNIGMALVAYASAYEVGLIDKERLLSYIERIISAVEKCEKYRGNLYNWYDCKTLAVLPRRFVSTVDSGNFVASLALARTYANGALANRIDTLIENTDLHALYDNKRKLFYIGYDDERKEHTYNHYDLAGSESMLTYLVACGYGKVPKDAFYMLNRHAVSVGKHRTVFSWTGGMFEYLMSRLFIAPRQDTLSGQAMAGAVGAHVEFAAQRKSDVWGVSECRYNAVDDVGGNLYRAFGVPDIAHSDVPENPPYAPYAAFLALPYVSDRRFTDCMDAYLAAGVHGKWGYYESTDGGVAVKSYMTHHQGMILASCANALKTDCLCARLQTLPQWRAMLFLCGEERISSARRKKKFPSANPPAEIADEGVYLCKCGNFSAIATADRVFARHAGKCLLRNLRVCVEENERFDLLRGEFYARESAVWELRESDLLCRSELTVLPSPLGIALRVECRNISSKERELRFVACAEPVLAREQDYEAHPAYSRMFVETGGEERYMWARRRNESTTALYCLSAPADVTYSGDKGDFYGRGKSLRFGQNLNPFLYGSFAMSVGAGETCSFTCYYLVAETFEQAEHAARMALSPDAVARFVGSSAQLARAVPRKARKEAAKLLACAYNALQVEGVSPDKPAIVCEITSVSLETLAGILEAYRFLYEAGFDFRLVFFGRKLRNEYPARFFDTERAIELSGIRSAAGDNVTVIQCDESAYKQCRQHAANNAITQRMRFKNGVPVPDERQNVSFAVCASGGDTCPPLSLPALVRKTGMGGFTQDGAYFADLTETDTPAPWCNIIADGRFGTVITESGGGFTFGVNSRQAKLTEWNNDPIVDDVSELIVLHDGQTSWSVTKKPLPAVDAQYTVLHARGYTEFSCACRGITARLHVFPAHGESRKVYRLELFNHTPKEKTVGAVFCVRPVAGDFRSNTFASLEEKFDDCGLRIGCGLNGNEMYVQADRKSTAIAADIRDGGLRLYRNLTKNRHYWGITAPVVLGAEETQTVCFSLSVEPIDFSESAEDLQYRSFAFYNKLCRITFDGEFGYLTEWLPYQVYNSRFAARTGFYQVSGAYGFRDQLQDCLALLYCDTSLVREHILECARHQFKEGDVQHWWHPPAIGVRTHICDDRLWLVYVTCEYIACTGDKEILNESVPFLKDVPISPQDASVYTAAEFSSVGAPLFEHCMRAIDISCDFGDDGLVRMRGGDWNDAMDKVGAEGRGTGVWCSMFLYHVIDKFLPYVTDTDESARLRSVSEKLYDAVCNAYDGDRFLRARCDDGTVLGSKNSPACKIDLLTQSWSVLAGIGTTEQKQTALDTAYALLCDKDKRLIRLFDPPFTRAEGVGYIGNYPQYVRENGGQYTQAAVWYVSALFACGKTERANELLRWLSPANRCRDKKETKTYCVEPYVSAADVYGGEFAGKGGWTWYTGSAAWLYKCLIERYAGIRLRGDVISFQPALPADTPELNVTVLFEGERIKIKIINSQRKGQWRVRIGEVIYNTSSVRLTKSLAKKEIAVIRLL